MQKVLQNIVMKNKLFNKYTKVGDYTVIDHTYDAVVVGAGGAGLRAAFGKIVCYIH